nr:solute carrier family 43 [Hymenolepis microstoma]
MCFCGVIMGMNSLFPTFQDIGIYGEVCQNGTKTCTEQIVIYANAFTTCCVVQLFMGVVIGPLIDYVGLRVINMVSSAINFAGLLMFAFLTPSSAVIIFIASTLSGIGGSGMVICTLSAGQLFTKTSSMVITLMQGVGDSSSGIFAFVHLSYKAGFSIRNSFIILALGALVAGFLNSLFVQSYWLQDMPKYKKDATDGPRTKEGSVSKSENEECSLDIRVDAVLTEILPSPKRSMRSLSFLVALIFFSLGLFQFNFYLAEFSIVVDYYFGNPEISERLSSVFTFVLLGGVPAAFLCGAIVDKIRSVYKPNLEHLLALPAGYERNYAVMMYNSRPAAISMYIFAVLTVIMTSLQFIALEAAFYTNFVFFLLMRGFLFTTISITVMSAFPISQFGTIFGTTLTIGGVFSLIQYALILPKPYIANSIALILALLLFIPPSIVFVMSSKALKRLPNEDFEQNIIEA